VRTAPLTILTAALSSLATLCAVLLAITIAPNAFRESRLSQEQRAEVAAIARDEARDVSDGLARTADEKGFSERQREEISQTVRELVRSDPELIQGALVEMVRKRIPASVGAAATSLTSSPEKIAIIKSNATALFSSTHQVTIGNPQGDVTLVEFLDYNCGYCRRAISDTVDLVKSDSQLKVVLKEFPILGPGSLDAARVGVAVRLQDPDGAKYFAFHQKLLASGAPADKATALIVAKDLGLDVERLENDMNGDEARQTIEENTTLARTLGITRTPAYVIGDAVVSGAVGEAVLKQKISAARGRQPG
jgi:protein-disulfide isomerase